MLDCGLVALRDLHDGGLVVVAVHGGVLGLLPCGQLPGVAT